MLSSPIFAQTFSGTGDTVPDDGGYYYFNIDVSGVTPTVCDTSFGLETVCINAVHTYIADWDVFLITPNGIQIELSTGNGGDQDGYINTCFNQAVQTGISQGSYPFTGTYRPEGSLAAANEGQNPNGIWQLLIHDTYPGADIGSLSDWSITFGNNPAVHFPFTSSNLPILKLKTFGISIPDEPKVLANMKIIDNLPPQRNFYNDFPNDFNGSIGIEVRGASSAGFPKKSYGVELWGANQTDTSLSILGMPPESDWVLHASYTDKSLMRNFMTYKMANDMGHYAARCRYVELFLNDEYQGVYVFMEKLKRDANRISVSKLTPTDNAGAELTGGYIFKIDKINGSSPASYWKSKIAPCDINSPDTNLFIYDYPKADVITPQQSQYIQSYMDSFELALMSPNFMDSTIGYRKYISFSSFIDATIINELSKNIDAYRISTYLHKEKITDGGKLKLGPVWDYDIAWRNADYYGGNDPSGWEYEMCGDVYQNPFWWKRFVQDSVWVNQFYCRWWDLRDSLLDTTIIANEIWARTQFLDESQERNFNYWQILGSYVWPNPDPIANTYQEEVQNMLTFINQRIAWMDANIPGHCPPPDVITSVTEIQSKEYLKDLNVYPNPFNNELNISFDAGMYPTLSLNLYDITGKIMQSEQWANSGTGLAQLNLNANLVAGIYLLKINYGKYEVGKRVLINSKY